MEFGFFWCVFSFLFLRKSTDNNMQVGPLMFCFFFALSLMLYCPRRDPPQLRSPTVCHSQFHFACNKCVILFLCWEQKCNKGCSCSSCSTKQFHLVYNKNLTRRKTPCGWESFNAFDHEWLISNFLSVLYLFDFLFNICFCFPAFENSFE